MNRYSKTQLRKGAVKASRPARTPKAGRKNAGVTSEEEDLLFGGDVPEDTKREK